MMEFTYDGLVRYGFGFYNPNHAAALICALMPFLWGWSRRAWLGTLISGGLTVALALTYSRTGVLVLAFELAAFFLLVRPEKRKGLFLAAGGFALILFLSGVFFRFGFDRSVANRPQIWRAGLALCAANPLGVGAGNSGRLASAFLLDGIHCRTLVSSHLTLLTECGLFTGMLWIGVILYALIRGVGKPRAWCAFAGLALSASTSSVFDWGVLRDFSTFGGLPVLNFVLSHLMLLFFLGLGAYLGWGRPDRKTPALAAGTALLLVSGCFCFPSPRAPEVHDDFIEKSGREAPLALYDNDWRLEEMLPFLPCDCVLALRPGFHAHAAKTVYLFGEAAEYAACFPGADLIFVSPPEFFLPPPRTVRVYLERFRDSRVFPCPVKYY